MTTTDECEVSSAGSKVEDSKKITTVTLEQVFNFLSENNKIVFKSQQISEPDLDCHEKFNIVKEVYGKNRKYFFSRYGKYLTKEHLEFFTLYINDGDPHYIIGDLTEKLRRKTKTTKNRRFAALQEMSKDTEEGYFSEAEMMKREPNLYEQLVGQYLTETERKIISGDSLYDPGEGSFSNLLLEGIERDRVEKLRKEQAKCEGKDLDDEEDVPEESNEDEQLYPKVPTSFRKQWGNFEDEDSNPGPSTSQKKVKTQKYVTAEERDLLREEFVGLMHSKFIEGEDEHFDYSTVDDNEQWDDLKQIDQDKEDAYFDEDDESEVIERMQEEDDDEEDDELDLYMKSIQ